RTRLAARRKLAAVRAGRATRRSSPPPTRPGTSSVIESCTKSAGYRIGVVYDRLSKTVRTSSPRPCDWRLVAGGLTRAAHAAGEDGSRTGEWCAAPITGWAAGQALQDR